MPSLRLTTAFALGALLTPVSDASAQELAPLDGSDRTLSGGALRDAVAGFQFVLDSLNLREIYTFNLNGDFRARSEGVSAGTWQAVDDLIVVQIPGQPATALHFRMRNGGLIVATFYRGRSYDRNAVRLTGEARQ